MRLWFSRFRRMTPSDYQTAASTLWLVVWVEAAIRVMPVSRMLDRLKVASGLAAPGASAREYQRLLRFVAVAYEILPFPATCLRRSLVLHGLPEQRGVPSRLCVGVAKDGSVLQAHAWIVVDGLEVDESGARFFELGS